MVVFVKMTLVVVLAFANGPPVESGGAWVAVDTVGACVMVEMVDTAGACVMGSGTLAWRRNCGLKLTAPLPVSSISRL